ncbi:SH3 domain-containing protein [Streptomyces sp. NPDC093984]|uniref:SH3 domain-containing protein n=1 Tax=Streptomyces sp. NPDC093984 TaxID=3366052 RepID=UPI0038068399
MIRRTLQSGLVAAVAMFALVPTAAVAADGGRSTSAPVVRTVPHRPHILLPAPARHIPARHRAHRSTRCSHPVRHTRHVTRVVHHRRPVRLVGHVATRHVRLNVRSGPGFRYRVVGHANVNGSLVLVCKKNGSYVFGNRHWYKLSGNRGYVSAHYVRTRGALPWC